MASWRGRVIAKRVMPCADCAPISPPCARTIERVIATGVTAGERSPKAEAIEHLAPVAFVDDFLPYFRGIAPGVHRALICRGTNGTPNVGPELDQIHSSHADLWAFSEWMRTQTLPLQ